MEKFKVIVKEEHDREKYELWVNFGASLLAGGIGSGITNCFDVLTINK